MTSVSSAKRAAKSARTKTVRRRKGFLRVGLLASLALAAVGGVIAVQILTGGSTAVEPPVGSGRILGDPDAPVTIVEYADFQCPICKRAATDLLPQIEKEYVDSGLVKIEFRHFPFLGQESWDAAQAAAAAEEQGKFWEYYAALFNAQGRENAGSFEYERLLQLAGDLGLDVERFDATLASNTNLKVVQADVDAAVDKGVNSTPTFFVGDTKIVGAQDISKFRDAIEHELGRKGMGGSQ
jgi:protein-disulfide isomerase